LLYPERLIPKTVRELTDVLGVAILSSPTRRFPSTIFDGKPFFDFDGVFYSIGQGVENLRKKLGDAKADQLLDMLAQAKAHHEEGWRLTGGRPPPENKPGWWENKDAPTEMTGWWQTRIGNALLQDMQMVVGGRQPWAYPKERYRWPLDPMLPELSNADLLKRDSNEDHE